MQGDLAPRLISEIRRRAGISQAELARRSNQPRSVINAYERAGRDPRASALSTIASAVGFEITIVPKRHRPDDRRAGRILSQVLDLAESLPYRRRRALAYPPISRRIVS